MEWVNLNKKWVVKFNEPVPSAPDTKDKELKYCGTTLSELYERMSNLDANNDREEYKTFLNAAHKVINWREDLPEMLEYRSKCSEYEIKRREIGSENFNNSKWCRPGMQIEIKRSNGKLEKLVIGDINDSDGVCDCCSLINDDDVIIRARDLLEDLND